jgi:HlyD family secretion protein
MEDPMDRPIDEATQRSRLRRRLLPAAAALLGLLVLAAAVPGWMRPSIDAQRLRIGSVERGALEATVAASGIVVPEIEQVVTAPMETRMLRILKHPGSLVEPGDAIVQLDVSDSEIALGRIHERIAVQHNEIAAEKLAHDEVSRDLATRLAIKKLELDSQKLTFERDQALFDKGIVAESELRLSEVNAKRCQIELQQLQESMQHQQRASQVRVEKLELQIRILGSDLAEAEHLLQLAQARADRAGVVTWVLPSEGIAVKRGDAVARIADLSAFRVEARLADMHAGKLQVGLPVHVAVGDQRVDGHIERVLPSVEDGSITALVTLDDPQHASLRPNLRVDVHVVTDRSEATLYVPRGSFPNVEGIDTVFVIHEDVAVRTAVQFGIRGFEHYEVIAGLAEGDRVILSDMTDHAHQSRIAIR